MGKAIMGLFGAKKPQQAVPSAVNPGSGYNTDPVVLGLGVQDVKPVGGATASSGPVTLGTGTNRKRQDVPGLSL